ncbi:MAG: hypothetical protein LJE69_09955 [Thiohalocapsa sp.]|nr:hypothetical protein [Thiohalocapsa sp.]
MINWHRLFGLTLDDYFTGTGYAVELEKDLARKRQLLDVLVIREPERTPVWRLPAPCDGLEGLRAHNLLTYKSLHESLDSWAIEELIGHYVNYRKAFAPGAAPDAFGLYAVSTRHPARCSSRCSLPSLSLASTASRRSVVRSCGDRHRPARGRARAAQRAVGVVQRRGGAGGRGGAQLPLAGGRSSAYPQRAVPTLPQCGPAHVLHHRRLSP